MDNFRNEEWRDIPNYFGLYQVSNYGRIKSLERIDAIGRKRKEKILKLRINRTGYYIVDLSKNSIVKKYQVHRLVYEAFNSQIPENMQVNHINEVKSDNRLENLNLMTPKENTNFGTGIERSAKKRSKVVLQFTLEDVFIKEYPSIRQAERETGFGHGYICDCCKGKYKTAYNYKWKYKENKKGED